MSTWQELSNDPHARWEHDHREQEREARNATFFRHAPPFDPLHDNAERLREIVGLVLEQMPEQDYDETGPLDPPLVIGYRLALRLANAYRASMGGSWPST